MKEKILAFLSAMAVGMISYEEEGLTWLRLS